MLLFRQLIRGFAAVGLASECESPLDAPLSRGPDPRASGEDYLVYDGGFPSLKATAEQRGNPGPNPGGRTIAIIHTFDDERRRSSFERPHQLTRPHSHTLNAPLRGGTTDFVL